MQGEGVNSLLRVPFFVKKQKAWAETGKREKE